MVHFTRGGLTFSPVLRRILMQVELQFAAEQAFVKHTAAEEIKQHSLLVLCNIADGVLRGNCDTISVTLIR